MKSVWREPAWSAQRETIRRKLLKIGAQVRVTFRKVWVSLAGLTILWDFLLIVPMYLHDTLELPVAKASIFFMRGEARYRTT